MSLTFFLTTLRHCWIANSRSTSVGRVISILPHDNQARATPCPARLPCTCLLRSPARHSRLHTSFLRTADPARQTTRGHESCSDRRSPHPPRVPERGGHGRRP